MVALFRDSFERVPRRIVLDISALSDDPAGVTVSEAASIPQAADKAAADAAGGGGGGVVVDASARYCTSHHLFHRVRVVARPLKAVAKISAGKRGAISSPSFPASSTR
jgi:hypothetical protein